jgi:hypothetical protein
MTAVMSEHRLEVADVFCKHESNFFERWGAVLAPPQKKAFEAISNCRTAALGGHVDRCDQCGHTVISYNSCRDRHCPKCQAMARAKWLSQRQTELLPVDYFHLVFTLPQQIGGLALQNAEEIYRILFRAASETLLTIAADAKHLGAAIGFLAVLHTWGQNLHLHPHLHCVVPGGGISPDSERWIGCRHSFFLPVRVLSCLFKKKFLIYLTKSYRLGKLKFHGQMAGLAKPAAFEALCRQANRIDWVVYAKAPFGGPEQVLKYLARYTHRVAISNRRLVSMEDGRVTFKWKDYAGGNQSKTMTLDAVEFIRRFLLHILPPGFVRIRQFGFLANRVRKEKLALCRGLLAAEPAEVLPGKTTGEAKTDQQAHDRTLCPVCKTGHLIPFEIIQPTPRRLAALTEQQDSS